MSSRGWKSGKVKSMLSQDQVANLMKAGCGNAEIAEIAGVSRQRIDQLRKKLGFSGVKAARRVWQAKLDEIPNMPEDARWLRLLEVCREHEVPWDSATHYMRRYLGGVPKKPLHVRGEPVSPEWKKDLIDAVREGTLARHGIRKIARDLEIPIRTVVTIREAEGILPRIRSRWDPIPRDQVNLLWAQGRSDAEIAVSLRCSAQVVQRIRRDNGWVRPKPRSQ